MPRGVLVVTVAMLVAACGSDGTSSGDVGSSVVVAGAQENAVATGGVCRDWPAGTTVVPCAVDAMGPGGGRVFYDAGSMQPWGRFLEVAPQRWNGTLVKCPGLGGSSCGTADKNTTPRETSDAGPNLDGYTVCLNPPTVMPGEAGATSQAIGDGRRNTEVLFQTPECFNSSWRTEPDPSTVLAVTLVVDYRGGGLADWYLPSLSELEALCRYPGRNAIGGFPARKYVSSSTYFYVYMNEKRTLFYSTDFGEQDCRAGDAGIQNHFSLYIRPIRAFA